MDIPPPDDMKWPGTEGFTGFPKHLPEDVVEYCIFIIDAALSDVQTRERLQAFQKSLLSLEKKFLKEYIWQRDSISLELLREEGRWFLKGTTNYGDSIADEWLIVYLLRELSKEFPNAWLRIHDSDGEFLLIEAANVLPKWVDPEVMEHRVWLNRGELRLIPLSPSQPPGPLKLDDALDVLLKAPLKAERLPKVEDQAFKRLSEYPKAIGENQHNVVLPLPRKIAWLLHTKPAYVAPVVEAFYLRDPISLRLLQPNKTNISLTFDPEDFVDVSVRFTRVLYAQLRAQDWAPPSSSPYAAAQQLLVKRLSAQLDGNASLQEREKAKEKADLSIKLSAGFEMLLRHRIYADKNAVREMYLLLSDIETGDESLPSDTDIASWEKREDGEAWLDIDWADFERELAGKDADGAAAGPAAAAAAGMSGKGDTAAQENLRKMVERFTAFIEDEDADLDGAKGLGLDDLDISNESASDRGWDDPASEDSDDDEETQTPAHDTNPSSSRTNKLDDAPTRGKGNGKGKAKVRFADPSSSNAPPAPTADAAEHESQDDASDHNSTDDEAADAEYAEYERSFNAFMTLSSAEKSALLDDARALAIAADAEKEEDEEIQRLSKAMEKELFGHGVLDLNPEDRERRGRKITAGDAGKAKGKGKGKGKGRLEEIAETAERFENEVKGMGMGADMTKGKGKAKVQGDSASSVWASLYYDDNDNVEEIHRKRDPSSNPADADRAMARAWADSSSPSSPSFPPAYRNGAAEGMDDSDDDDMPYLDADYNLADNMLRSFKGQVGMPGPAGNLMRMMGVQFPPDMEDDGDEGEGGNRNERGGGGGEYARALEKAVRKGASGSRSGTGSKRR